jgi:putative SOS response-associated peptidase YedK
MVAVASKEEACSGCRCLLPAFDGFFPRLLIDGLMCGRFSLFSLGDVLARRFGLVEVPAYAPRYNIAPTSRVMAVVPESVGGRGEVPAGREGQRAVWMHWGLQPGGRGSLVINARSEAVHKTPLFREAVRQRRCLVPADGFFEWQATAGGKRPFWFSTHRPPFAFAALWSPLAVSKQPGEQGAEVLGQVAILTTDANPLVAGVHDRMPVILQPEDEQTWLDPEQDVEGVRDLLQPYPDTQMTMRAVTKKANDAANEGPGLIEASKQRTLF